MPDFRLFLMFDFFFKEGNLEPLQSELYHMHPKHKRQVS